ncbi:hypothetical protein AVEN_56753-1 [Araneus ventricosus]|uniref:RNA-directed DNA polymerase n=1 Tax=Araneus ventricosus TaxID=182803 RepID=A0A4Y2ITD5_ARAVE|nr:hypothetical protein AVEN_56753-1 [Araneus ventricosus]
MFTNELTLLGRAAIPFLHPLTGRAIDIWEIGTVFVSKIIGQSARNLEHVSNQFIDHLVCIDSVRPNPEKVKALCSFPTPNNSHDVRSFLGLCSYFRRFIKGFCYPIAKSLLLLLKGDAKFYWGHKEVEAFKNLKKALTSD